MCVCVKTFNQHRAGNTVGVQQRVVEWINGYAEAGPKKKTYQLLKLVYYNLIHNPLALKSSGSSKSICERALGMQQIHIKCTLGEYRGPVCSGVGGGWYEVFSPCGNPSWLTYPASLVSQQTLY